jgi:hypothetical protein
MFPFPCQCGKVLLLSSKVPSCEMMVNCSVMIPKMDRKALTARLYYDLDGPVEEDKIAEKEENA